MGWEYSDFSHEASEHGGPIEYINEIRQDERQKTTDDVNKKWISGILTTLAVLTPFVVKRIHKAINEHKQKKLILEEEAKQAEEKLIEIFENQVVEHEDVDTEDESC